jgi:hypothetical protein
LLTGRFAEAAEMTQIGLVNRVGESKELISEALKLGSLIASNSPVGVRLSKQVIQTNVDAASIEAAVELGSRSQALVIRTADMSEALKAFKEKRNPTLTRTNPCDSCELARHWLRCRTAGILIAGTEVGLHELIIFTIGGLATASIYAITASGLMLTCAATGIFNWADRKRQDRAPARSDGERPLSEGRQHTVRPV